MAHFLWILRQPDNLPIVGMLFALVGLLAVWLRQALRHDRLIAQGRAAEIAREMRR